MYYNILYVCVCTIKSSDCSAYLLGNTGTMLFILCMYFCSTVNEASAFVFIAQRSFPRILVYLENTQ